MRVGIGIDFHKMVSGRRLILGGVHILFDKGLLGHSDADVLTHSVCDALLGAAGLGDIGRHFPDTESKYKGISSLILLKKVKEMIEAAGFEIVNIDSTIIAQEPKLSEYMDKMAEKSATVLNLDASKINVKATTTEGLGGIGKGNGIAAYTICSLQERNND